MLTTAYKIFAKVLATRLSSHLKEWIRPEQKGFVRGRYILDAIIALWEGIEYAEESGQDFCFFKIDFDKAYDRLEWGFLCQSLTSMGLQPNFIRYVKTLFGNARARIAINGQLSSPLTLNKSIRQGCPLAPLLYAIATDGLSWLVNNRIKQGKMEGIHLPGQHGHMCLQLFADDTNALVANKEGSIKTFWECLNTFCLASGSMINHAKTGIKTLNKQPLQWAARPRVQGYPRRRDFPSSRDPHGVPSVSENEMALGAR